MVETLLLSVGASAGTAATVSTVVGAGLTAASAFGSIMGGSQQNAVYKAQAQQYELSARTEELKGREQADKIRRGLQATLASQNAAFAARGISLNSGTPLNLGNVSKSEASKDIEDAQFNASMASGAERLNAVQSRISGKAAKTAGYGNAMSTIFKSSSFGSLIR